MCKDYSNYISGISRRLQNLPQAVVFLFFVFISAIGFVEHADAACGATTVTWNSSSNTFWSNNSNWLPTTAPTTSAVNAIIVSGARIPQTDTSITVGCVEIQSGTLTPVNGVTTTVAGDYFRNLTLGSITSSVATWTLSMNGAADQTLENVDNIYAVKIASNKKVTSTQPFNITNNLTFTGTGATFLVNGNMAVQTAAVTIPATDTLEIGSGVSFTATGGITVNGTLKINPGGQLVLGNGKTLSVGATGLIQLAGASGSPATITASGTGTYTFTVAGSLSASYFVISRTVAAGMNVTGTITAMDHGEFHFITGSGYAVTMGAAASIPVTMTDLGFFDDLALGTVKNINATAYNLTATTLNNWSGIGGAAYETDPNGKINWGTQAGVKLTLTNNSPTGIPTATIAQGAGPNHFATFCFALTNTSTATDITSVVITNEGTANSGDIAYIQIFKDNGDFTYGAGDTQVGGNTVMNGSPMLSATVIFSPGDVRTSSSTPACIHILVRTSPTAMVGDSISMGIHGTSDVVNSQGYSFSDTASPPIKGGFSAITGGTTSIWNGTSSTNWSSNVNWANNASPSSTTNCMIGSGTNILIMTLSGACQNATLETGGTTSFNSAAWEIAAYAGLIVQAGHTFTNAGTGVLALRGASNQTLQLATTFPGNLLIANTGVASSNIVSVDANSQVAGTLTVTSGVLKISTGKTLTVTGSVTVATGATLQIDPGATLVLGNGSALTVNLGGTLQIIGSAGSTAAITSDATTSACTIVINGTIMAQYYSISRLGVNGLTINSGATIDPTNYLQNGSFTYPVSNNTNMLRLFQKIPGNALSSMVFDAAGSAATGAKNIYLDSGIAAPLQTLAITTYSGTLAGPTYENDLAANYSISWTGATNTLNLTAEATAPATANQGATVNMGRWGFQQTQAGASYVNTDITSLKITMNGTGTSSDVAQVRAYYDLGCTGSGGALLGSGTFSGSPASLTLSGLTGATVQADVAAPPKRCIYVEYDIAGGAGVGNTVGAKIQTNTDQVNSQSYATAGSTPAPIALGSATIQGSSTTWTAAAGTTNWFTAGNWSSGVPTNLLNCIIGSAAFNPNIGAGTAVCRTVNITNGNLSMAAGTTLEVNGDFTNTGTFTQGTGILSFKDTIGTNQTVTTTGNSLGTVSLNKTFGAVVQLNGFSFTIGTLTMATGNGTFRVQYNQTLTLTNGVTVTAGTFEVQSASTVAIPTGKGITVNGGTFKTSGTNDAYPQATTNKGKVTVSGAGTWFFTATSGAIDLTGFIFDYIDVNGVNLSGTTSVTNLNGGQFTNLSNTYASVKAFQFNNSGTIPATASNVGWNWGASNTPPAPAATYYLATSTGCSNHTISFDQWFGDFFVKLGSPDTMTKVSAVSCTINISAAASPVSITSLTAQGYDNAIMISWQTGMERDHAGFNVYRSNNPGSGFVQINDHLIRNGSLLGTLHGNYQFLDQDAVNGTSYYYQIEDISNTGARVMHGPVSATPRADLGAAPSPGTGYNSGTLPTQGGGGGSGSGSVVNAGEVSLGNGVKLLARTQNSMRVEITIPAPTFAVSVWDPAYKTVSIPGFSSTAVAGSPELLNRTVLIETLANSTVASLDRLVISEGAPLSGNLIAPAPSWSLVAGQGLMPSWASNPTVYSQNVYSPAEYVSVSSQVRTVGDAHYVQLQINPLRYNPSLGEVHWVSKIVLDIGLDGTAWRNTAGSATLAPGANANTLRIRYTNSSVYQLSYDDISGAGLDGPWSGADTAKFRLFFNDTEIPMEVLSGTGLFSTGDSARFYAPKILSLDDDQTEIILAQSDLLVTGVAPLRIQTLNADPTALSLTDESGPWQFVRSEEDHMSLFNDSLGEGYDHFYWGLTYKQNGGGASSPLNMNINLPGLDRNSADPVRVRVHLKGGRSEVTGGTHHLGVFLNSVPFAVANAVVRGDQVQYVDFLIPANYFVAGQNVMAAQAMADYIGAGYYDLIYIDKVDVWYRSGWMSLGAVTGAFNYRQGSALQFSGYPSPSVLQVYDISTLDEVSKLSNVQFDSGAGTVTFGTPTGGSDSLGHRYQIFDPSVLPKPDSIALSNGVTLSLKDPTQAADLIVIGTNDLLAAARDLIKARRDQGLRVVEVNIDQIYVEFSAGQRNSKAIKDFLQWAYANWTAPVAKYVLMLGDASYDPRQRLGNGIPNLALQPMPLEPGLFADYGSDNWFVADSTGLPTMAIGRLPSSDPAVISGFAAKILAYEAGKTSPVSSKMVFIADQDTYSEGFSGRNKILTQTIQANQKTIVVDSIDRATFSSDAELKTAINSKFDSGPLVLTYFGHGAENVWADAAVFANADAESLKNPKVPIVLAMGCLSNYFYDADPTYVSIGEKLLFNNGGGAIAVWGSTTTTAPSSQSNLANAFFAKLSHEVGQSYHVVRMGDVTLGAKTNMAANLADQDTMRSWTLLGDPSMPLPKAAFEASSNSSGGSGSSRGGCGVITTQGPKPGAGGGLGLLMLMVPFLVAVRYRFATSRS